VKTSSNILNYWQSHALCQLRTQHPRGGALANQAIYELNQRDARSGIGRMVLPGNGFAHNTQVAVAHVGDSRLYRLSHKGAGASECRS